MRWCIAKYEITSHAFSYDQKDGMKTDTDATYGKLIYFVPKNVSSSISGVPYFQTSTKLFVHLW